MNFFVTMLLAVAVQTPVDTMKGFAFYNHAARVAYDAKDYAAYREHMSHLAELVPTHPRVTYNMASAEALNGDSAAALKWLRQLAAYGMTIDPSPDADFASIKDSPGFRAVLERIEKNKTRISHSDTAFVLADSGLVPEDIVYDARGMRFLVSSLHQSKIVQVDANKATRDLVSLPGWAVSALKVDAQGKVLWVTAAAVPLAQGYAPADSNRSAVLKVDLNSGAVLKRYELSRDGSAHFLGDIALNAQGDLYAADSQGGGIYVIRAGIDTLATFLAPGIVTGPQNPAISPDGKHVYIADYLHGIFVTDQQGRERSWLAHADTITLAGIDGLYVLNDRLIAVQNGTRPNRVLELMLDATGMQVTDYHVLEVNNPILTEPTHGAIVDGKFYLIANSENGKFDNAGQLRSGAELDRTVILRVQLTPRNQ